MRDEVYSKAEELYYYEICRLNAGNKNWQKTKPTLEQFKASLTVRNVASLVAFHEWLTRGRAQDIAESLGFKSYK